MELIEIVNLKETLHLVSFDLAVKTVIETFQTKNCR